MDISKAGAARSILKETYEKIESTSNGWNRLYMQMHNKMVDTIEINNYAFEEARRSDNYDKNRYIDVLPYDHNRVMLTEDVPSSNRTGYINASPFKFDSVGRHYILAQGPLHETSVDFWQMVWENKVPAIIMLNRIVEGGIPKCYEYFPSLLSKPHMQHGQYTITCTDANNNDGFVHRQLELKKKDEQDSRKVHHIQYTEWPDHGVPPSTARFLCLLAYIRSLNVLSNSLSEPPVVIHCSAGIGRTGTFVLVDIVLKLLGNGTPEASIDIPDLVNEMRKMRCGLVQTPTQLKFAWAAILSHLEKTEAAESNGKTVDDNGKEEEKKTDEEIGEQTNGRLKAGKEDAKTAAVIADKSAHESADKKRRSESSADKDDEVVKRREKIELMVAKSREHEARLRGQQESDMVGRWLGLEGYRLLGLSPTQLALSGLATASAALIAATYFYGK